MTVDDLGERALIERIRARAGDPPSHVIIGIGDDAAVLEPGRGELEVLTTDTLVEDIHFRRAWTSAHAIGRKAVTVNLSDLAAMGAAPRAILFALCLPPTLGVDDFDALVEGAVEETRRAGAALVGGNITQSPGPLVLNVTALGGVARRRVLRRDGARAGDELWVTGAIGGAAAGLAILATGIDRAALPPALVSCVARYETPAARLRCGRVVAGHRAASAAMDLSDGLADAVRQVAQASGLGARVDAESLPLEPGARAWFERHGPDPIVAAVAGGDDYELLFAVPARRRRAFLEAVKRCSPLTVTKVGVLTRERELVLETGSDRSPLPSGYSHLSK